MRQDSFDALNDFNETAKAELDEFFERPDTEALAAAADLIFEAQQKGNRLHVSGIGKPAHVAGYAASLLSSTGTPAYELHGTEAVHGSCGQLMAGDIVICISNSGTTAELLNTARAIINNGCKIISVTGNPDSALAQLAQVHLYAGVGKEGGPLNRAPRTSILAECIVLQRLSVLLQAEHRQSVAEYVQRHPGGALGKIDHK